MRAWSFYVGLIGCTFGYLFILILIGYYILSPEIKIAIPNIVAVGVFTMIGLVGSLVDNKKLLSGLLLLLAGLGIAFSYMPYSFIPAFFFLPAGALNLLDLMKLEKKA